MKEVKIYETVEKIKAVLEYFNNVKTGGTQNEPSTFIKHNQ
jgi:hypothetical protein